MVVCGRNLLYVVYDFTLFCSVGSGAGGGVVSGSRGMRWEVLVCAAVARRVAKGGEPVGGAWWELNGGGSMEGLMRWLMVGSGTLST
jgi:hypothetical protein